MPNGSKTAIVISSDANYFDLLMGTVRSLRERAPELDADLCILDVGLTADQVAVLKDMAASVVTVGWDLDFPGRDRTPGYFKAMVSRPYLPNHFPGYETYMWIDSDAWVQDASVISLFLDAAADGSLAIVPEIDRGYVAHYKRPRSYWRRPSHRMYRWAYGWKVADRLGRNPILNSGAFALRGDAPHWRLWQAALKAALCRWRLRPGIRDLYGRISEQTALNYVVFGDKAPATFLPAYCNWLCGHGALKFDPARRLFVEPHAPHQPLGIVHLAGDGVQNRVFDIAKLGGGTVSTGLKYPDAAPLIAPAG
ncbi:MAG: hypothetical protein ABJ388_03470 [Alphaproteobacteria bacterium]